MWLIEICIFTEASSSAPNLAHVQPSRARSSTSSLSNYFSSMFVKQESISEHPALRRRSSKSVSIDQPSKKPEKIIRQRSSESYSYLLFIKMTNICFASSKQRKKLLKVRLMEEAQSTDKFFMRILYSIRITKLRFRFKRVLSSPMISIFIYKYLRIRSCKTTDVTSVMLVGSRWPITTGCSLRIINKTGKF